MSTTSTNTTSTNTTSTGTYNSTQKHLAHMGHSSILKDLPTRTFTTSKGHTVFSPWSDREAAEILYTAAKTSKFARDLCRRVMGRGVSENQRPWLHKLAADEARIIRGEASPRQIGGMTSKAEGLAPLVSFMAAKAAKHPRIRLHIDRWRLTVAGKASRNAGMVYVKSGDKYVGKIDRTGSTNIPAEVIAKLQPFADDPEAAARRYGKMTGNCCFCGLKLTDERSVSEGYGPVCAKKWDLPWGKSGKQAQ